jgi:hypothetical protein
MPNLSGVLTQLAVQRKQLQQDLSRLDAAIASLRGLNTRNGSTIGAVAGGRTRRRMSVAARKRIAAAQRARWAKWKAQHKKAA